MDSCKSDIEELLEARTADEARLQAKWLQQRTAQQAQLEASRTAAEEHRLQATARYTHRLVPTTSMLHLGGSCCCFNFFCNPFWSKMNYFTQCCWETLSYHCVVGRNCHITGMHKHRLRANATSLHLQLRAAVTTQAWNVDKLAYNSVVVAACEEEHQAMLVERQRQVSRARVEVGHLQVRILCGRCVL